MTIQVDILVVGAGPAGLAAAQAATALGCTVGLIDDNPKSGGQIWRGGAENSQHPLAVEMWDALRSNARVQYFPQTKILYPLSAHQLLAQTSECTYVVSFNKLILATGAREYLLPFPGWTLPRVTGAGGLQALVKGGLPIQGKRVVVAGTGPLLLAVADTLKRRGAHVVAIVEQAPLHRLIFFWLSLLKTPEKFIQSLQLLTRLKTVPYYFNSFVASARGTDSVSHVMVRRGRRKKQVDCDYLASGYGLIPNTELARALGCAIDNNAVQIDEYQQTSVAHIFSAGECTGIGGVDLSIIEGRIAGLAAAGNLKGAASYFSQRLQGKKFSLKLNKTFALRDELRQLCDDVTIICRCEDVTHGALCQHPNWKSAKLATRCGMGSCQSKICGAATQYLYGWTEESARFPLTPARIGSMITPDQKTNH